MSYLSSLKTELTTDPLKLGYAPFIAAGAHSSVAALLNALTGSGSATVSLSFVDRNAFLAAIRPALLSLPTLSTAIQAKWDRILNQVNTTTGSIAIDATTVGLLAVAVTDGVLTQAQANAVYQRIGSRAEVLFGAGAIVGNLDVAQALGS